jgi:hypothetical protein
MAEFIYKDYSCKLKFGAYEYELPLNEQTAALLESAFSDKMLPPKFEGIEDIDAFYNKVMDAIDEVLGEGAAENIMSRFAHAGTMELLSVVNYIMSEWRTQYNTEFDEMKKTAHIPNRETRRAANKGGRR